VKLLRIVQYAGYVTFHWGIRVGLFTLWQELRGEFKYRISTTGFKTLTDANVKGSQLRHATEYMPVNYALLEQLLGHLPAEARQGVFLDIGCGTGRALCVAATHGFKRVRGFDFDRELLDRAEKNLALTKARLPETDYQLRWCDLHEWEMTDDVSVIFLFNPFDKVLTEQLLKKIEKSLAHASRPIWVLYASPRFAEVFLQAGFEIAEKRKLAGFIEGIILKNRKAEC